MTIHGANIVTCDRTPVRSHLNTIGVKLPPVVTLAPKFEAARWDRGAELQNHGSTTIGSLAGFPREDDPPLLAGYSSRRELTDIRSNRGASETGWRRRGWRQRRQPGLGGARVASGSRTAGGAYPIITDSTTARDQRRWFRDGDRASTREIMRDWGLLPTNR